MSRLDELILGRPEGPENPLAKSEYLGDLFKSLMSGSRASSVFPVQDDFKYYESFPEFRTQTSQLSKRLLSLIDKVCQAVGEDDVFVAQLDSDLDKFNAVVENVDNLLEQVDLHLDDMSGLNKNDRPAARAVTTQTGKRANNNNFNRASLSMLKPQLKFKDKVDNSITPFVPILPSKPHAQKPLPNYAAHAKSLSFPHPYEFEITNLVYTKPQVSTCKEQLYLPLTEVPCHWIDSEEQLRDLEQKLTQQTEFAVDLEHHSFRTFLGFTCLMQISTRTEDFLIDTLELRHALHILNSSFANPKIVKVLHGADMDVQWLQRDLGLYLVNLFDTGQAGRVLELPYFSLAWLLKHYCDIELNKKYQLADWRTRPLSLEMLLYAREDTHYLLYVYDRLRNQLIETNQAKGSQMLPLRVEGEGEVKIASLLVQTLERSQQVALKRFEKPVLGANEYTILCGKLNLVYSDVQLRVMQSLIVWRDNKAREDDESIAYIMPNHVLVNICNTMPLDSTRLLDCCRPATPPIRAGVMELIRLVHQAQQIASSPLFLNPPASPLPETSIPLSPAMSTEQLYYSAGWTAAANQGPRGAAGLPLFDISGFSSPSRLGKPSNSIVLPTNQSFSSLLRTCPEPFNQTARDIRAQLQNTGLMGVLPTSNLQVKREHAEDTFETPHPPKRPVTTRVGEILSPEPPAVEAIKSPEGNTGIPRTMHEIYQLSNENRQRNKEKKKSKEEGRLVSPPSVHVAAADSPASFMQNIGWMDKQRPASDYSVSAEYFNPHGADEKGTKEKFRR